MSKFKVGDRVRIMSKRSDRVESLQNRVGVVKKVIPADISYAISIPESETHIHLYEDELHESN